MGYTKGLCVLALLACCTANFVPVGKQLVYEYEAIVKAGTLVPTNHASQFKLRGHLNAQCPTEDMCHVFMSDLKYELYNGELNHHDELMAKQLDAPSEIADLMKPFAIKYDGDSVVGIMVDEKEAIWSVNMKKSIATILQLEGDKILADKKPHGFKSVEQTIYGLAHVLYNVLPKSEDYIEVEKMIVMPNHHKVMRHTIQEVDVDECDAPHQPPYSRDAQRKYFIVKDDGHKIVKRIEANGGIYYHPFEGKSVAQYLFVNQTMEFVKKVDAKPMTAPTKVINDMSYTLWDESVNHEAIPTITLGRRQYDMKKTVSMVMQDIEGILLYMKANHIHMKTPNMKYGQTINKLKMMMAHLDKKSMDELYEMVMTKSDEVQEVFFQLLPIVGTRASLHVILKAMGNDKLNDMVITDMLEDMPKHIMAPSQHVLEEMEVLMTMESDPEIKHSAVLAFSNIVASSYRFQQRMYKYTHYNQHFNKTEWEIEVPDCKKIIAKFEKYVTMMVEKVKSAKTYGERLVYISALSNMGLDAMVPHLIPMIRGEVFPDHNSRLLAMWALASVASNNPEQTYNLMWPILTNTKEHTEMRIVAYWIIMETLPYKSTFMNMYWTLMNDPCMELYHFHYTYMKSLANRADRCYGEMKVWARELLRYMNPPTHGVSEYEVMDYEDVKYGFGQGLHRLYIRSNESITLSGIQTSQIFNLFQTDYLINIKINGFKKHWDLFTLNTKTDGKALHFNEKLYEMIISNPELEKDMSIEVILMKDNQIVNTMFFDQEQLAVFKKMPMPQWFKKGADLAKKMIMISYEMYAQTMMPTDIGMPALLSIYVPEVHEIDMKVTQEMVGLEMKFHVDGTIKTWSHSKHGIFFYNVFADIWQGINRIHSYDDMVPLLIDVSINTQQKMAKISFGKHDDVNKDVMGMRSHVAQVVFMKEQDRASTKLQKSSPNCKPYVMVTRGDKYRHNYPLAYHECPITGRNWEIQAYDSEVAISNGTFGHARHMFYHPHNKHYKSPFQHMILSAMNMQAYFEMLPMPKTHGFFVKVWPRKEVSNVDLTVRFDNEFLSREMIYSPAHKTTVKMTYALKNAEKSLKTWDMNAVWERNAGHTNNNLKMEITRIIPGQKDYKVCIDGTRKWSMKGVTGHMMMNMGQTADNKCVKDDASIEINMVGEKSEEQKHPEEHAYHACEYPMPYSVTPYHTMHCMFSKTSIRKYVYDIKTNKVPTQFKHAMLKMMDMVKSEYYPHFQWEEEHHNEVTDQNMKIEVIYPMSRPMVDVEIYTNQHVFSMTGLPAYQWAFYGFHPDSVQYPRMMYMLHEMGRLHFFKVDSHSPVWNKIPNKKEYTMMLGNDEAKPTQAVFVQEVSDNVMSVKIVDAGHSMELTPEHVKIDGQDGKWMESHDWVFWNNLEHEHSHKVALMFPHSGLFVIYDGQSVIVLRPPVDFKWHGLAAEMEHH